MLILSQSDLGKRKEKRERKKINLATIIEPESAKECQGEVRDASSIFWKDDFNRNCESAF